MEMSIKNIEEIQILEQKSIDLRKKMVSVSKDIESIKNFSNEEIKNLAQKMKKENIVRFEEIMEINRILCDNYGLSRIRTFYDLSGKLVTE
jgi:predicted transcriptional regulator